MPPAGPSEPKRAAPPRRLDLLAEMEYNGKNVSMLDCQPCDFDCNSEELWDLSMKRPTIMASKPLLPWSDTAPVGRKNLHRRHGGHRICETYGIPERELLPLVRPLAAAEEYMLEHLTADRDALQFLFTPMAGQHLPGLEPGLGLYPGGGGASL